MTLLIRWKRKHDSCDMVTRGRFSITYRMTLWWRRLHWSNFSAAIQTRKSYPTISLHSCWQSTETQIMFMWQPLTRRLNPISYLWLIWTVLKKKQTRCRCYKEGSQVHMHPESRYWCPCHSLVACSGPLFWYINACWNREQASSHQLKIHLRVIATGTGIGASRSSCIQWVWPDWNILRETKAVMLECISEGWRWSSTSTWKTWHCRKTKESDYAALEQFTCQIYAPGTRLTRMKDLHWFLFSKRQFTDEKLPPTKTALVQMIDRSNYVALIWKQCVVASPALPDPKQHAWYQDGAQLVPTPITALPAPQSILVLVQMQRELYIQNLFV